MKDRFRQSMAWLHAWVGLLAGWVLFFVFVTGTAGYFQSEITRWMRPELPLADSRLVMEADFLVRAVRERQNILIAGGTSTGKTTLANALLAEIAATGDRVLVLEDTIELQCAARDHVPLRTRQGVVSMQELVRSSMRLRPDRVVVGEVRGPEALDLIKVWGTGHPGGIATVHAGSPLAALLRLEQLILEVAVNPPRALIAEAVNVVIHIAGRGRKRRIESIARVAGFDGAGYHLADALEAPFPELTPVHLAADPAAPSLSPDQPGELP